MALNDIIIAVGNELDLDLDVQKNVDKAYVWANSLYRSIVLADDFPWRRKTKSLFTKPPIVGTVTLTYGETTHRIENVTSGIVGEDSGYNYVKLEGEDSYREIGYATHLGGDLIFSFLDPFTGASATDAAVTLYHSRYSLGEDIREDWVDHVYNHTTDDEITRIRPNSHRNYIEYSLKTPSTPKHYFMYGKDASEHSMLFLAPSPDAAYDLTAQIMMGPEDLDTSTDSTLIPDVFEFDVLFYGICMLYCMSHKEEIGKRNYQELFGQAMGNMLSSAGKDPGRVKRVVGYAARAAEVRDLDVPYDWEF